MAAFLLFQHLFYFEIHLKAPGMNGCIKDGTTSAKQCGLIRVFSNAESERKDLAESVFFLSQMTQRPHFE